LISTFKVYIQNGKVQRSHGEREKRDGEDGVMRRWKRWGIKVWSAVK